MKPLIVGDVVRFKRIPGDTFEVMEVTTTGYVRLKTLTVGTNMRGVVRAKIGREYTIAATRVNSQFELITAPLSANGSLAKAADNYLLSQIAKTVEPQRPKNSCGCDCGGFATYQSDASHYHSSWCFVNSKGA